MALIGSIEPFKGEAEEFESYLERIQHLFKVNAVEEDMQVSMFITLAGPQVYQVLKNLAAPEKPSDLSYSTVTDLLRRHYSPTVSEIYERYVFNRCNQKPEQSVAEYIVELRKLASTCNFGQFLDVALRDRFVCGIISEHIQKQLLAAQQLTFADACQKAQVVELAEKHVKTLVAGSSNLAEVHSVEKMVRAKVQPSAYRGTEGMGVGGREPNQSSSGQTGYVTRCKNCGRNHPRDRCPAVKWRCYKCSSFGHVQRLCPRRGAVGAVEVNDEQPGRDVKTESRTVNEDLYCLNQVGLRTMPPYQIKLEINGKLMSFEVDTGACKSIMAHCRFNSLFNLPLRSVQYQLNVVSGQRVKILGECKVNVRFANKDFQLSLVVIESAKDFVPLLGRNWLSVLFPNWQTNFSMGKHVNTIVDNVRVDIVEFQNKYPKVFDQNLCSPINEFEVKFNIKEGVVPIFRKAYSMSYALKPKVECKLKQMVDVGILERVSHSEWASPIVVVPKKNNDVRICTDFRVTVNKCLNIDQYPLPVPEDIFASLAGGRIFTVLDLSGAYQQLKVHPDFQKYLTINTHTGLFRFTRLTYGIACAPAIFQAVMDQILCGIEGVHCYLDDILLAGKSMVHAKDLLHEVLGRLHRYNVKVNAEKCLFFREQVEYLGHRIDAQGLHPSGEKLRAIVEAPQPQNITQLRAYLGLLNYYHKFVPMLASQLRPLYRLLEKGIEFKFDQLCVDTFQLSKKLLVSNQVLTHFDPSKTVVVSCDASSYGVGGVLSHRDSNGTEKPVYFVSGSLSKAEQNYSQLEREALAIIFCVKRFHKYLYGRPFILVSDHQPLKVIFNPDRNIPVMSASRIIRWGIILSAYDYRIEYKKGAQLWEADMLSRLPLSDATGIDTSVNAFNMSHELPVSAEDIAEVSSKDPILRKVLDYVKTGWPGKVDPEMKQFFLKRHELSVEDNCLMVGIRVVVPKGLQKRVLELMHEDHAGIVRTKMLVRSVCWWPGLQQDIETLISECQVCQLNQRSYEKALIAWPKTEGVFQRVHVDFFYRNKVAFLLIVDSKSRWVDIHCMSKGCNLTQTIEKLKVTFSIMGIPDTIVSDNGPPFNAAEFYKFCHSNGINVLKSPPYHPQSNGSAERHVQTVKMALDKYLLQGSTLTIDQQLVNFLFSYRNTPCTATGLSPNELIFKVKPKTRLDLLKPRKGGKVLYNKEFDIIKPDIFSVGDAVLVGQLGPFTKEKWKIGVVVKCVSAVTYLVRVDEKLMYKHANSLRKWVDKTTTLQPSEVLSGTGAQIIDTPSTGTLARPVEVIAETETESKASKPNQVPTGPLMDEVQPGTSGEPRRSSRVRRAPERLNL